MWKARVFTLYPEIFPGPLNKGLYGKAMSENIWDLKTINIRDYTTDKHKTVDDTPYGGGSGMLIKPDVLGSSLDKNLKTGEKIIYFSPKGKLFNQSIAKKISKLSVINLICGSFEGIDAVIDKDLTAAKLGRVIRADEYYIVTDIDQVYLNYGKDNQSPINQMTDLEAKTYQEEGQLGHMW